MRTFMPEERVGLLTETHVHEPFRPKTILRSCGEDSHGLIGYFIYRTSIILNISIHLHRTLADRYTATLFRSLL